MILSNTIYFQLIYSYLYYIEGCTFYFCSRSNSRKIRRSFKYLFIIRNNEMLKKINFTLFGRGGPSGGGPKKDEISVPKKCIKKGF